MIEQNNQMEDLIEQVKNADTFDEIARIKDFIYKISIAGGIDIEEVLAGLYKSPTRFIFELLQNAEDAKATRISITLEKDSFIFEHDGRPFTLRDIKGITGVNNSEKAEDFTKIGAFGIGFKSVFGVCDAPEIYSDDFNFKIRNCYVPQRIETNLPRQIEGRTYIVLPFKKEKAKEIYTQVEATLKNLPPETMLFLNNINQIDYLTDDDCGFYRREKLEKSCGQYVYWDCTIKGVSGTRYNYYIFEDTCNLNDKFKISIAYSYNAESKKITKISESNKVVVFFPTEEDTFLSFVINGPYQTTKTRESIPQTEDNLLILDQTIELYKNSLLCFKELGLISTEFIENLPLFSRKKRNLYTNEIEPSSINIFYEKFYEATRELFKQEALFPTDVKGYASADEVLLARGQVTDLLSQEDILKLFNRSQWLSTEITKDKTLKLYSFLQSLKVKEVDFEVILTTVDETFLKTKNIDWFVSFYSKGLKSGDTLKKHLTKAFILTESGDIVAPFVKNKSGVLHKNVYLPSNLIVDKAKYVSKELYEKESMREFFRHIGIEEMDVVESIRTQWLPVVRNSLDENEHYDNFYLLFLETESQDAKTKTDIKNLLSNSECIFYKDCNGDITFHKPREIFMSHGVSKTLYDGFEDAFFINEKLDNEAKNSADFYNFLTSLGVVSSISLIKKQFQLSSEERKLIMQDASWSTYSDCAYDILGLDHILQNITKERSYALWSVLNTLEQSCLQGELEWKYYGKITRKSIPSYFIKKLQEAKWIYDGDGIVLSPSEIYEDDVRRLYGGGSNINVFTYKPDLIKQLPPEEQQILELTKGLPLEFLQQMREQYLQMTAPTPININPETSPVDIDTAEFSNEKKALSAQELTGDDAELSSDDLDDVMDLLYGNSDLPDEIIEKIIVHRTSNEAELDGDLGERFVISSLKKKYQMDGYQIMGDSKDSFVAKKAGQICEIKRHNTSAKKQKGYDITITADGNIIEYIEVKSKKSDDREFFKVSGLQWEFAKKLHQEGQGEKHFVYVVSSVRTEEKRKITKVSNPYKAWIDGDLEADPVRIKY